MDVYSYENLTNTTLSIGGYTILPYGEVVSNGSTIAVLDAENGGRLQKYLNGVLVLVTGGSSGIPATWTDASRSALVGADNVPVPVSGAGNRLLTAAAIGDSRMVQCIQDQSAGGKTIVNWSSQGALTWFNFLTYQAIDLPPSRVFAYSGATTTQIAAQVDSVLALSPAPRLCFINGGTNSFSASATYAQAVASFTEMTNAALRLRSAGIVPVLETDAPRTVASWSSAAAKVSIAYNRMLRDWCRTNGVRLADSELVHVAINGGTSGDPVSGYKVADGIHDAQTGAIIRGLAYQTALSDILPGFRQQTSNPLDAYDATYLRNGNLLTGGLFQGTSGTTNGTGSSGSVATGWQSRVISGTCTCVASKEAPRADGGIGDFQIQTISTTTASVTRLEQSTTVVTTGKLSAGDTVYAEVDVEVSAISGTVEYFQLNAFDWDGAASGSISIAGKNTFGAGLSTLPTLPLAKNTTGNWLTALRGRLRTAPIIIGQTITSQNLHYRLETSLGASSGMTIKWGDATLRRV